MQIPRKAGCNGGSFFFPHGFNKERRDMPATSGFCKHLPNGTKVDVIDLENEGVRFSGNFNKGGSGGNSIQWQIGVGR